MDDLITIYVLQPDGSQHAIEVPTDMTLNLMEVLKASDYPILATCGGMALCATCHVQVLSGADQLNSPEDQEIGMLDNLPNGTDESRLSCQIPIRPSLHGLTLRVLGEDQ